jgi:hypothetical protein
MNSTSAGLGKSNRCSAWTTFTSRSPRLTTSRSRITARNLWRIICSFRCGQSFTATSFSWNSRSAAAMNWRWRTEVNHASGSSRSRPAFHSCSNALRLLLNTFLNAAGLGSDSGAAMKPRLSSRR